MTSISEMQPSHLEQPIHNSKTKHDNHKTVVVITSLTLLLSAIALIVYLTQTKNAKQKDKIPTNTDNITHQNNSTSPVAEKKTTSQQLDVSDSMPYASANLQKKKIENSIESLKQKIKNNIVSLLNSKKTPEIEQKLDTLQKAFIQLQNTIHPTEASELENKYKEIYHKVINLHNTNVEIHHEIYKKEMNEIEVLKETVIENIKLTKSEIELTQLSLSDAGLTSFAFNAMGPKIKKIEEEYEKITKDQTLNNEDHKIEYNTMLRKLTTMQKDAYTIRRKAL